ncbi:MAG TPA: GNAT family N-acetyltransferase [Candidatus Acidoferrales bacterium]|nr:GNAT family N-acetyltransferase [Candidatus Acidoferrales bacterium]
MNGIHIRPAGIADLAHILRHRRAMFRDMGRGSEMELDQMVMTAETFFRAAIASGGYRGWLAETVDGQVVAGAGITILSWPGSPDDSSGRRGWVQNVYTEPEYRRLGLARQLMETLMDWCREEGFRRVYLHASDDGRPMYESMGFVPTNEMRLMLPGGA